MKYAAISRLEGHTNNVYLTFDDGPEPGITEFILDELDKYGFKATFFCTGANAVRYPELMGMIKQRGHAIGNHSYGHRHAYELSSGEYKSDIYKADKILKTELFRPPNGCLRFVAWMNLRRKFKICYWTIASGDWKKETFDINECKDILGRTRQGDFILFHFVREFETATRKLIPWYLKWLADNGYKSEQIK